MLDAIGFICSDLQKTIKFYEIFGLKFEQSGDSDHWEANLASGLRVMLDSEKLMKEINPDWTPVPGGRTAICFKQDSSQGVDELYQQIVNAGFKSEKEPWDAFWGQRYSVVRDPDGNQVDIFASL